MDIKNKSKNNGITNCVINLPKSFITASQAGLLINGVFDHCLLFSGQIPMSFPMFRERVNQAFVGQENISNNTNWSSHLHKKQINLAKKLVEDVSVIKNNVIEELKETDVTEAVIALGSTIFTAKQAIVIKVPPVDRNHYCVNHQRANVGLVMHLMRSLCVSDVMRKASDFNGKSTKVFLLLRKSVKGDENEFEFFTKMPGFQLPSKCKRTHLKLLLSEGNENEGNCCKLLQICEDISNLSIQNGDEDMEMEESDEKKYDWFMSSLSVKGLKHSDVIL